MRRSFFGLAEFLCCEPTAPATSAGVEGADEDTCQEKLTDTVDTREGIEPKLRRGKSPEMATGPRADGDGRWARRPGETETENPSERGRWSILVAVPIYHYAPVSPALQSINLLHKTLPTPELLPEVPRMGGTWKWIGTKSLRSSADCLSRTIESVKLR